jgi:hypothetical protein
MVGFESLISGRNLPMYYATVVITYVYVQGCAGQAEP